MSKQLSLVSETAPCVQIRITRWQYLAWLQVPGVRAKTTDGGTEDQLFAEKLKVRETTFEVAWE